MDSGYFKYIIASCFKIGCDISDLIIPDIDGNEKNKFIDSRRLAELMRLMSIGVRNYSSP